MDFRNHTQAHEVPTHSISHGNDSSRHEAFYDPATDHYGFLRVELNYEIAGEPHLRRQSVELPRSLSLV